MYAHFFDLSVLPDSRLLQGKARHLYADSPLAWMPELDFTLLCVSMQKFAEVANL